MRSCPFNMGEKRLILDSGIKCWEGTGTGNYCGSWFNPNQGWGSKPHAAAYPPALLPPPTPDDPPPFLPTGTYLLYGSRRALAPLQPRVHSTTAAAAAARLEQTCSMPQAEAGPELCQTAKIKSREGEWGRQEGRGGAEWGGGLGSRETRQQMLGDQGG